MFVRVRTFFFPGLLGLARSWSVRCDPLGSCLIEEPLSCHLPNPRSSLTGGGACLRLQCSHGAKGGPAGDQRYRPTAPSHKDTCNPSGPENSCLSLGELAHEIVHLRCWFTRATKTWIRTLGSVSVCGKRLDHFCRDCGVAFDQITEILLEVRNITLDEVHVDLSHVYQLANV